MDRQLTQKEQSQNRFKKTPWYLLGILLLGGGYYLVASKFKKSAASKDLHIVKVERGDIQQTLTASGTIIAASERVINAPVSTEIEDVLLSTGAEVKKGDLILKLDREYTQLEYEGLKDELSLRDNSIDKLKLQYDKDLRDLDYRDQIKALQLSELKAQLSDQKRLLEIGGATAEEVEAATLQLNIASIEKKILENELTFKRKVNATDKNQLQLEFEIQQKQLKKLERKLNETKVRATGQGVITWINEDIGKKVAEGEPLVRIANLNRFEVEAITSDRNSKQLQVGLPVEMRINKEKHAGIISRILPEIVNNTVKFYVSLEADNHKSLRPNLRAEIFVIKNKKENVLRAKRGPFLKGTATQKVYKVIGDEAVETRFTKGLVSSDYFEITNGLKEGDRIIISDTEEYDHMPSFTITSNKK